MPYAVIKPPQRHLDSGLVTISRGPRKHFPIKHIFKKAFTLYWHIKSVPKDTEALDIAIFLRGRLALWRIRRAGRVPVITKLAYPHRSAVATWRQHLRVLLKRKYSLPAGNKAHDRIKASTFTGRSYRVSRKVESAHK